MPGKMNFDSAGLAEIVERLGPASRCSVVQQSLTLRNNEKRGRHLSELAVAEIVDDHGAGAIDPALYRAHGNLANF